MISEGERAITLRVRLSPNASRDAIEGVGHNAEGLRHLVVRVRAVPEKGKANKSLIDLLSKTLGIAKRYITVIKGHTSRLKTVSIQTDENTRDQVLDLMEKYPDERPTD
jgi:uncharacterized protein (TIGR00251 family)